MRATGRRRGGRGAKLFAVNRGCGEKAVAAAMIAKRNHALRRRQSIDAARYRVQSAHSGWAILSHRRLRIVETTTAVNVRSRLCGAAWVLASFGTVLAISSAAAGSLQQAL